MTMKTKNIIIAISTVAVIEAVAIGWLVVRGRDAARESAAETPAKRTAVKKKAPPIRAKPVPETASASHSKPKPAGPAKVQTAPPETSGEKPKADDGEPTADAKSKSDNPFPRYLDMFRNDPAALAAEFEKEAEADRANHRKMRDKAIAKLKLNGEQAAVFEKALDGLKNAIFQHEQEEVDLITSGQANMDTAADGKFWNSNLLLMDQFVAAKEKIVRDAAVELYNQLAVDSVPDAEKQEIIKWATYNTSFSFDCYEPILQVYDKVYKNMGFGKGIFSWCVRPPQKK